MSVVLRLNNSGMDDEAKVIDCNKDQHKSIISKRKSYTPSVMQVSYMTVSKSACMWYDFKDMSNKKKYLNT